MDSNNYLLKEKASEIQTDLLELKKMIDEIEILSDKILLINKESVCNSSLNKMRTNLENIEEQLYTSIIN